MTSLRRWREQLSNVKERLGSTIMEQFNCAVCVCVRHAIGIRIHSKSLDLRWVSSQDKVRDFMQTTHYFFV